MPLLWLSLAFIAGILLGSVLGISTTVWLILGGMSLLVFILGLVLRRYMPASFSQRFPRLPVSLPLLLLALFLGAARYQSVQPNMAPDFLGWHNDSGEEVVVEGVLSQPPEIRDQYTRLTVQAERIGYGEEPTLAPVRGKLMATVRSDDEWKYGDLVRLEGKLEAPPEFEDFSYRDYLARQGIYSTMAFPRLSLVERGKGNPILRFTYGLKMRALDMVYRIFPDPEASLVAGVLLGVDSGIPEELEEAFRDTGTSHILVISGFNIAIVAGLFMTVFGRVFGRWRGAAVALIGIAFYTLLVGAEAPVVRAAIMGGLAIFAVQLGRRQVGVNTLAIAAGLLCLLYPLALWDVGFQLSFGATLGLVIYAGLFSAAFINFAARYLPSETAQRVGKPVGEYLLFTLAAQLVTLPLILYHFQHFSLITLIANPFILPAQPPLMILSGIAVLLWMIYQPIGQAAAYLAYPFAAYTIRLVELFDRIPFGAVNLSSVSLGVVVILYVLMFGLTFMSTSLKKGAALVKPALVLLVLGSLTVLVWRQALSAPDGRLHMTLLGTGGDDALLIQTPNGRNLLVNGGPSARRLSDALGRRLAPFDRKLDWLVVAGSGEEHIGGVPGILERFQPANVLWAGEMGGSRASRELIEALTASDVPLTIAAEGQALDLGAGAKLHVLAVGETGGVFLVEWGNFRLLLLPVGDDSQFDSLARAKALNSVTALVLLDSGSLPDDLPDWLANLSPQIMLLGTEAGAGQSLSNPETLKALQGYNLLRTDQNGWIHLSTDGDKMWVEMEK